MEESGSLDAGSTGEFFDRSWIGPEVGKKLACADAVASTG
jgi:hypothetical protein